MPARRTICSRVGADRVCRAKSADQCEGAHGKLCQELRLPDPSPSCQTPGRVHDSS
jgi:hypothetical protein